MQKYSVQKYCSLLKHKIPQYRAPNERNTEGSSITIYFHSCSSEKTYWKAKNCSKFRRRASLHDRVFKLFFESSYFLPTTFAVILSPVALPVVPKVECNFEAVMHITIFVFLSPGSCLSPVICNQNLLESASQDKQVKKSQAISILGSSHPPLQDRPNHTSNDDKFHKISTQKRIRKRSSNAIKMISTQYSSNNGKNLSYQKIVMAW